MLQEGYRRVSIANAETWYGQPDIPPLAAHDLRWYLGGIWQHKCRAAACIAAALAGAVLYLAFAPPVYEARVKLLIESQNPNVVDFADVLEPDAAKLDYYETQVGILRSRTLAHRTLDRLNLWSSPTFAADGPDLDATAARSSAVDTFLSRLSIAHRSADRLLDARFRASDPRLAADVANALAHVYIEHDLELRRRAAKGAAEFLNARIEQQRTQVENRELAVQRYREEHTDVAVPESKSIAAQQLVELSAAATRAKSERIEVEAMARQLDGIAGAPPSDVALPAALGNAVVDQLKIEIASLRREETRLLETYGPRHPAVVRVQAALRKAEEQLRGEITAPPRDRRSGCS